MATPIRVEQLDRSATFRWQSHRIKVGAIILSAHQYGAAFRARSDETAGTFTASFPLSNVGGKAEAGGESFEIARERVTFVSSPSGPRSFDLGTGYRGLQVSIDEGDMTNMLVAITGRAPKERLRFEPKMALDGGTGAALQRLLAFLVTEIDHGEGLIDSPLVAARFSDLFLTKLLVSHPHDAQRLIEAKSQPGEPHHVRAAAEWLEANAEQPVRMSDLPGVTGISLRALQAGFVKFRGLTPTQFLRDCRLDLARRRLTAMDARPSVAAVARACGFTNLGRFSAEYFARFGEYPSATRARRS